MKTDLCYLSATELAAGRPRVSSIILAGSPSAASMYH
jgi:hypothetical protein